MTFKMTRGKIPKELRDGKAIEIFAIDPGDKHVGFARLEAGNKTVALTFATYTPDEVTNWAEKIKRPKFGKMLIVIESFRLYPWMAHRQGFSSFETPQLIGVLRYILDNRGFGSVTVMQQPSDKKAGFMELDRYGLKVVHAQQHPKDAAAHAALALTKEKSR